MSEIRRYDTFNDVEFPSTDGPYYMVADADAKLATLANELLAANMAWANKCEENAALTAKLAESRAALKDAESRALTPCPDCGWIAGERTVLLDMEDNSENAD